MLGQEGLTVHDIKGWGSTPSLANPADGEVVKYLPVMQVWVVVAESWAK